MSAPKLKSCPFCGGCLEMVSAVHYRHPKGKCVISGHVFPKGYIGQWNTRVAQPDPRDEVIKGLVEALERLNAACDAMWNDDRRIEKINGYFTGQQPWQIKEAHMRSISEAQQRLPSALAAAKAVHDA